MLVPPLNFDQVRSALVTDGAVRLSAFGRLPVDAFDELLALLALALDAPKGHGGTRRSFSIDGRVEIVVRDPRDGGVASVTSDDGTLQGPDLLVSISLIGDVGARDGFDGLDKGGLTGRAGEWDHRPAPRGGAADALGPDAPGGDGTARPCRPRRGHPL